MSRAKFPGAGFLRLSLTGVICLSLASVIWTQESHSKRVLHQPAGTQQQPAQDSTTRSPAERANNGDVIKPQFLDAIPGYTPVTNDDPDFAPMEEFNPADGEAGTPWMAPKGNPYVLAFNGGSYAPQRGIDPQLTRLYKANPTGFTYGYVMLRGRMADLKKVAALEKLGVKILGVHTYQSYVAQIPMAQLPQIGALPFVHWVGYARPDQKLEARLLVGIKNNKRTQRYQIDISVFDSDIGPATVRKKIGKDGGTGDALIGSLELILPNGRMHKGLEELGFEFNYYTEIGSVHIFEGWATAEQILQIRDLDYVSYIEMKQVHGLHHDQTVAMIGQDRVRGHFNGSSITLGIIDTGVSNVAGGSIYKNHQDLGKRMWAWSTVTGENGFADGHGHGTHVTGTMIGEGKADRRYMGNAPGVGKTVTTRFFVGRYFDSAGKPKGSVGSLYSAMRQAYTGGGGTSPRPRAINNSWGADAVTVKWIGSESGARLVDDYVNSYGQTYVFSSGNAGVGVGSPSSAKNALTVGAVIDYWSGAAKPGDLRASSQYGTKDGRRKPEIVAPGSVITSTRTKTTNLYTNKSGTSMASPHMSGSIASLIQRYSPFDYKPHQIKAQAMAAATWQGNPGTSTGWFGSSGFGLIDTYKMTNGSTRYSWASLANGTVLTSSGKYFYADVTVPSDVTHAKLVMSFIERSSGPGAAKARVCDVRVYIDIAPFTAGGNTGEYVLASSVLTSLSKGSRSFGTAVRGKKVRIKVYGQYIPSGYLPKAAWTLFYYRKPTAGTPVFSAYAVPAKVKPSSTFYWVSVLTSATSGPEFSNARIYPNFSSLFPIQRMYRYTQDKVSVLHQYLPTSSYPSSPWPSLTRTTLGGMTVGSGYTRYLSWNLKAPTTSNVYSLTSYAALDPYNLTLSKSGTICVDGLAPRTVSGLTSTTHPAAVWRNSTAFVAKWSAPVDMGCAGIGGLAYSLTSSSSSVPLTKNITGAAISKSLGIGNTSGLYFHIRAVDNVGNLSAVTSHFGPIRVDLTRPVLTKVHINNNAAYATSLNAFISITASDSYSGPSLIRYSCNNATWSPWRAYTTSGVALALNSYGGNTLQGTKRVYVQVRDRAGNVSLTSSDSIVYDSIPPVISTVAINGGATYTRSSVVGVQASGSGATYMQYSFNGSTWSGFYSYSTGTRTFSVGSFGGSTTQGTKTAYVRLRDVAGNYSAVKSDTIIYDSVAPVITMVRINNGAAYTNSTSVVAQVLGSGSPSQVQYSFNGTTWSAWMSYTTGSRTLNIATYGGSSAQGVKTLYARLRDGALNTSVTKTDTIIYDSIAPNVTTIRMNSGAAYTTSTNVSVQVLGSGTPSLVQYSFNGSTWSSWMSYTTGNRTLNIASYGGNTAQGVKTVYARLRDGALNVSLTRTDTIIYDSVPPVLTSVLINSGAAYTNTQTVGVKVTGSGATYLQYSFNGSTWSGLLAYTTASMPLNVANYGGNANQGTKTCYMRLRDPAGNLSAVKSDSIIFDSIAPAISLVRINAGSAYTNNPTVSVQVLGTGVPNRVQYSFNGSTWSPWMSYTSGSRSMNIGSYGGSASEGVKTVYARLLDAASNFSLIRSDTIIYDKTAPVVTLVRINGGATHTSSSTVSVQVVGTGNPTQVSYSFNGTTWSTWMSYTTGTRSMSVASYGGNLSEGLKTVYARLRDTATNMSATRTDTITYDKTAPIVTQVSINGGATYTSSATVSVQVLGSGNPTQVQYSFNGSTWSSWMAYTTGTRNLSVASYGGNSNTGTKTLYARIRDAALNLSTTRTDTIIYMKVPVHTTLNGLAWFVIHDSMITLTGSGFADVNRAYIGPYVITSTDPEDWHKGYYRILSDSKMEVYPPQNLVPGTYTCYVRNAAYRGANFSAKAVHNTTSKTGVPPLLKSGKVFHVYTHRGPKPATTVSVLTFSVSALPLVIPGLISLGHGGNTATFIDPTFTIISPGQLHNASTRTAHWAFPTPPGKISGKLYWQSVMFDAANPTITPIPVSTTDVVKFYK